MQDNGGMHLVIDHAAPGGSDCQAAVAKLQLPNLARLLKSMAPGQRWASSPDTMTPVGEQVRAAAMGLRASDGLIPWAALDAQRLGLASDSGTEGWAWITPCHWKVNADHVEMLDPVDLALSDAETAVLLEAMRGYFAEDGIALHPLSAGTWLAQGAVFKGLPTASLERVRSARIDTWMPRQTQASPLRRLQNEMQMLLYTHPLNDTRAAQRRTTVNSFWVSGTGDLPQGYRTNTSLPPCRTLDTLRTAALRDDAALWVQAWQTLDTTELASVDTSTLTLTLCGEHGAQTFIPATGSWLTRLRRRLAPPSPNTLLAAL
jgi:hypothetical protein